MDTWQSVLIAIGAMATFVVLVVAGVLAIMYFQRGSVADRLRDLRHK